MELCRWCHKPYDEHRDTGPNARMPCLGKKAHFEPQNLPGLTDPQLERLALLQEELGESVQAVGKILRHGFDSSNPFDKTGTTNREMLQDELGDVLAAIELLIACCDLDRREIDGAAYHKISRVERYLHHQRTVELQTAAAALWSKAGEPTS